MTTVYSTPSSQHPLLRRPPVRSSLLAGLALVFGGAWSSFHPVTKAASVASAATTTAPAKAGNAQAALLSGKFHGNVHPTSGTASILDLGGGHRVLRLTDFTTSNGPDVHVILVPAADVTDKAATVKRLGYVELGGLKGNKGNQNYDVPASVDLAKYRAVTIWCKRFEVNFGSAPLTTGH